MDFTYTMYVASALIVALLAAATPLFYFFRWAIKRWVGDTIEKTVRPYLTNDDKTVANYAHEAAQAAEAARCAAFAAEEAAYAAKSAALEARDAVISLKEAHSK